MDTLVKSIAEKKLTQKNNEGVEQQVMAAKPSSDAMAAVMK